MLSVCGRRTCRSYNYCFRMSHVCLGQFPDHGACLPCRPKAEGHCTPHLLNSNLREGERQAGSSLSPASPASAPPVGHSQRRSVVSLHTKSFPSVPTFRPCGSIQFRRDWRRTDAARCMTSSCPWSRTSVRIRRFLGDASMGRLERSGRALRREETTSSWPMRCGSWKEFEASQLKQAKPTNVSQRVVDRLSGTCTMQQPHKVGLE